jgi:UDP-2,3-diacylglucosamine hydrolase
MPSTRFDRPGRIVFVSDAHLGAPSGAPQREEWLARFLTGLRGNIAGLMIVGDLFDFWFEYRHAIPKGHFQVLRAIADLRSDGVPVVYFGGNHDFWAGSYLKEEIGIEVTDVPLEFLIHGRRIFVAHGDGLGGGDHGYKILKRILRNRLCIGLYRAVHPDVGIPFAYGVSSLSRRHTEPREVLIPKIVRDVAAPRLRAGVDAVVMGHVHEPAHLRLPGGDFLIIGDWMTNFTYVALDEGRFSLHRYLPGSADEVIPPEVSADR